MSIEIYCFSGTGNSLHIARELQRRIPEINLIPIVSCLNNDNIGTKAGSIGFVFPAYAGLPPVPVMKFLKKINLKSSDYIFSIITRAHSPIWAEKTVEKLLKKNGKCLDAGFILNMPGNCEGAYTYRNIFPTKEIISNLESQAQIELDRIKEIITNKQKHRVKDNPPYPFNFKEKLFYPLLALIGERYIINKDVIIGYVADSTCTGCGICAKICLSGKIRMSEKKPEWQEKIKCYFCWSCYNYCPSRSIMVERLTKDKSRRYHHPEISADDISMQKI